jgi:hypothetical protein
MPEAEAAPPAPGATAAAAPPLDEVMLAMDVVDTLRHAETLVERELSVEERRAQLKQRLREIYAAQGIDVPDHVLDEGVAALEEQRFTYTQAPAGFGRTLARIYVTRGRWGRIAGMALAAVLVLAAGWWFGIHMPAERRAASEAVELAEGLPQALRGELERVDAVALVEDARVRARSLAEQGEAAARAGDLEAGRALLTQLRRLREDLERSYTLRIVNEPGEMSGVWREPEANPYARNYYLIVEAVDADDRPVEIAVTSEEDGRTERTSKWGIRVDEATFERVVQDKSDDGIIEEAVVGEKPRGYLEPRYMMPVRDGRILEW